MTELEEAIMEHYNLAWRTKELRLIFEAMHESVRVISPMYKVPAWLLRNFADIGSIKVSEPLPLPSSDPLAQ